MDLRKNILAEHSKAMKLRIARFIGDDQGRFDELMACMLSEDPVLSQRAAWPLSEAAVAHPRLIKKHWGKLVRELGRSERHPAVARNILRIFEPLEVPEKYAAQVLDLCYGFIRSEAVPVAIRAYAITVAASISNKYPDLKKEMLSILGELGTVPQQPAIRVRVREAIRMLAP